MTILGLQTPLHSGTTKTHGDVWFQISKWLVQKLINGAKNIDKLEIEFVNRPILNYLTKCLYNEYQLLYNPRKRLLSRYYKDLDTITPNEDKQKWNEDIWERFLSFHIPEIIFYTAEQVEEHFDSYFANDFLSISPKIIGDLLYNIILKNYIPSDESDSENEQPSDSDEYYDEYDV